MPTRFVSPLDWGRIGATPRLCLAIDHGRTPVPVRAVVHAAATYNRLGPTRDPGLFELTLEPTALSTVLAARVPTALEPGFYVASARTPENAEIDHVAFEVLPEQASWPTAAKNLVDARPAPAIDEPAARARFAEPVFTITTTVYDTDPWFIEELAQTLIGTPNDTTRAQSFTSFEWLVLDNGSNDRATREALTKLASRDPRVRVVRVERNLGIVGGNRFVLERAKGAWVVPCDADDVFTTDALAHFLATIADLGPAADRSYLYSDEQKIDPLGEPLEPIFRGRTTRAGAADTIPASHLMCFPRAAALEAGLYTDARAHGCHDWDTTLRLLDLGLTPVHVPEVLYGWRVHAGSTSGDAGRKDRLTDSHTGVLRASLVRRGLENLFELIPAPGAAFGYYHARRLPKQDPPLAVDLVLRRAEDFERLAHTLEWVRPATASVRVLVAASVRTELGSARIDDALSTYSGPSEAVEYTTDADLARTLAECPDGVMGKAIVDLSIRIADGLWLWGAIGTLELDPQVGVAGGPILDPQGRILHAGVGLVTNPEGRVTSAKLTGAGRRVDDPPGPPVTAIRRGVTAVCNGLCLIRREAFAALQDGITLDDDTAQGGLAMALALEQAGWTSVLNPGTRGVRTRGYATEVPLPQTVKAARDAYTPAGGRWAFGPTALAEPTAEPQPGLIARVRRKLDRAGTTPDRYALQVLGRKIQGVGRRIAAKGEPAPSLTDIHWTPPAIERGDAVEAKPTPKPAAVRGLRADDVSDDRARAIFGRFSPAVPLNLITIPHLAESPRLNIVLPGLRRDKLSGGPNTALNIGYRLAARGVPVRFFSTDIALDPEPELLFEHMRRLSGIDERLENVELVDANDRHTTVGVGERDVFMATAWWTAQMIHWALPMMRTQRFIYLVQDIETVLHDHSSQWALAQQTYAMDFLPVVNHPLLFEHLVTNRVGRFGDPELAERALVIDPAIDRAHFHPEAPEPDRKRRLLFYARPMIARRNLFEVGLAGLRLAAKRGVFDGADWEIAGMGEHFDPIELTEHHRLECLPWMNFEGYARTMRQSDVLLSLMLSPHPSYPPLEMAACGGVTVTNSYGCKTAERMASISPRILAADPDPESVAAAIAEAVERADAEFDRRSDAPDIAAPPDWDTSLAHIVPGVVGLFERCVASGGRRTARGTATGATQHDTNDPDSEDEPRPAEDTALAGHRITDAGA